MMDCRLAEVAKVDSGAGFPLQYQGTQNATFPFLKVSDMNLEGNEREIQRWNNSVSDEVRGKLRAKAFPAGSLIFPKIGAAIGTNKKRQLTQPSCVDNNVMAVIPKAELLEPDFLYFLFLAKNISDFASDSNPPSIRKSEVENWQVRVPTLSEQRRIVDILSRAAGIVRLRREAQQKAAELVPGIFIDMFGDPATNPKGWDCKNLGDFSRIIGGSSLPPGETYCGQSDGVLLMKVSDMNLPGNEVNIISCKEWITEPPRSYSKVATGTIVFPKRGASIATNKKRITTRHTLLDPNLMGVESNEQVARTAYLYQWFSAFNLADISSGTTVPQLNKGDLTPLVVPIPPLLLQKAFEEKRSSVFSILSQQITATAKAEATFSALLAHAFSSKENL
ncbi:restriction endonuclease subunit S [Sulfuricella sp.]|uniref:restriction endonuclease subunit S n=1 Tax=Sulfuricella sp. TaxID=2099377 RepID=UPI002C63F4F3|nr:restriction endonuclease subunit S [Sulfuricella sp.]HUX64757.1 restriction endonuclease subunit S [Sulfuricella sp.]